MSPEHRNPTNIDIATSTSGLSNELNPSLADDRLFQDNSEVDVARVAHGIARRWRLIALVTLLTTSVGVVSILLFMKPNYVSRAAIQAVPRSKSLDLPWAPPASPRLNEQTVLDLVESRRVMEQTLSQFGEGLDIVEVRRRIGVEWPRKQDVFFITAGQETAEAAQRLGEAATEAFIKTQNDRFRGDVGRIVDDLERRQAEARGELQQKERALIEFQTTHSILDSEKAPEELIRQLVDQESRAAELRAFINAEEAQDAQETSDGAATQKDRNGERRASMSRGEWRRRKRELLAEQTRLRKRYTDAHPRLRRVNAELKKLRAGEPPRSSSPSPAAPSRRGTQDPILSMTPVERRARAASLERAAALLRKRIDDMTQDRRQLELLRSEVETTKARWQSITDDLETARTMMALRAPLFDVVEPADLPDFPEGGKRRAAAAGSLFLGLLLGTGLALLREIRDTRVRSSSDVERLGVPVLSTLMTSRKEIRGRKSREAVRLVAQSVRRELIIDSESPRCLLVTSAVPHEGKSELARELCQELLRWGEHVVKVDGNLRDGYLPVGRLDGYLMGAMDRLLPEVDGDGVPTITSGNIGDEAPGTLSRRGLRRTLRLATLGGFEHGSEGQDETELPGPGFTPASAHGSLAVIDGPAFLPSVDGELLAEASDSVLIVVRRGETREEEVTEMVSRLRDVGRPITGAVLTQTPDRRGRLRRLLFGPQLALALAPLLMLLAATGCGPYPRRASDTLEDSNAALGTMDAREWQRVGDEKPDLSAFRQKPDDPYIIGEGDVLELVVMGYPEMTRGGLLVRPDGRIGVPLLGDVHVAGLRPERVSELLTESLSVYLKDPVATVLVQRATNYDVLVLGLVKEPGKKTLSGPTRLLQLLAACGGLVYRDLPGSDPVVADLRRATLMRGDQIIPIDFARLLLTGDRDQNVFVRPGDVVHLPPMREQEVYVLGEVQSPRTVHFTHSLTLLGALTQAGGLAPDARTGQVRVIRGSLTNPRVYLVDVDEMLAAQRPDVPLRPGDIVYVSMTPLAEWNHVLQQIVPTLQALLTTRYLIEGTPRPLYDLNP